MLWWSPDPRMVLRTSEFKLAHSLRKTLHRFVADPRCELRFDSAFNAVIEACANAPRDGQRGTWIVPELRDAYQRWHRAGSAHSIETWVDGRLVGGLYGVNLGRMFYGESMFTHATDASKIALAALVAFCRAHDIDWIDCQQNTAHLASLGAREVSRAAFEAHLAKTVLMPSNRGSVLPEVASHITAGAACQSCAWTTSGRQPSAAVNSSAAREKKANR